MGENNMDEGSNSFNSFQELWLPDFPPGSSIQDPKLDFSLEALDQSSCVDPLYVMLSEFSLTGIDWEFFSQLTENFFHYQYN